MSEHTHLNPRPLAEIESALGRNYIAEHEAEESGFDEADILLEREFLYREREARLKTEPTDDNGYPIGVADTPPALASPVMDRMAELRLTLLRCRRRICADCDASRDIDTAIAEVAAIRSELGLEDVV